MAMIGVALSALALVPVASVRAMSAPAAKQDAQGGTRPRIATEAEARRALLRHGLADVTALGPVGDYWEANARAHGEPVVAYLFDDGTVWIKRHPRVMVQLGTRLSLAPSAS